MATQTRAPTSDQSVSGTWTGSAGSRYQAVDDYPDTTPTDYLEHGTTAGYLVFGFSAFSIPAGSTSISVQVRYYDAEPANGNNKFAGRLVVGGTAYNATEHNPSGTSYTTRSDDWATNPKSAAAWTVDDVNGVGANALQYFGFYSSDANPVMRASCIQLQVTYTPPQNRGQLSWAEMEVPNAPRRGQLSWGEFEVPGGPRRGMLSWGELEIPNVARRGLASWAEFELPTAPRRGQVSWSELETPDAPVTSRRACLSWAEAELPAAPRRGLVSWAEMELPLAPRRGYLSWGEFEIPSAPGGVVLRTKTLTGVGQ